MRYFNNKSQLIAMAIISFWVLSAGVVDCVAFTIVSQATGDTVVADKFDLKDSATVVECFEFIEKIQTSKADYSRTSDYSRQANKAMLKAVDMILSRGGDPQQTATAILMRYDFGREIAIYDLKARAELFAWDKYFVQKRLLSLSPDLRIEILSRKTRLLAFASDDFVRQTCQQSLGFFAQFGRGRDGGRYSQLCLSNAININDSLVKDRRYQLAAKFNEELSKSLAISPVKELSTQSESYRVLSRRYGLIGNKIDMLTDTNIVGTPIDGRQWSIDDYSGKVTLVYFWTIKNDKCVKQISRLQELLAEYGENKFSVIGVCLDHSKTECQNFIQKEGIKWLNLFPQDQEVTGSKSPMASYYGVKEMYYGGETPYRAEPEGYLLNKDSKVVSVTAQGTNLEIEIDKLLGPPANERKGQVSSEFKAQKLMMGTWKLVGGSRSGEPVPQDRLPKQLVVDAHEFRFEGSTMPSVGYRIVEVKDSLIVLKFGHARKDGYLLYGCATVTDGKMEFSYGNDRAPTETKATKENGYASYVAEKIQKK